MIQTSSSTSASAAATPSLARRKAVSASTGREGGGAGTATCAAAASDDATGVADGTGGGSANSPAGAAARSASARSFATRVSRRIFIVTAIASSFASTILPMSLFAVQLKFTMPSGSSRQSTVFGGLSDAFARPTWLLSTVSEEPE